MSCKTVNITHLKSHADSYRFQRQPHEEMSSVLMHFFMFYFICLFFFVCVHVLSCCPLI